MRNDVDAAASVLGGIGGKDKPKGKLKVAQMHIHRGHAGGFIVKHDLEDEGGTPHPKQHEFPLATMEDLRKHLDTHMGDDAGDGGKARQNAAARGSASPQIQDLD